MALQTTWFFLWGLIWALFFITGGYDLGIGSLYPFLGKTEMDKFRDYVISKMERN